MPFPSIAHPAPRRAVVLLSGGLDSAVCLAIARSEGWESHALSFAYGQRHAAELDAARCVAAHLGARTHRVVTIDLAAFGGSALTDLAIPVPHSKPAEAIPLTYVPARNTIFLSYALGVAEVLAAGAIYIGVNAVDYSGYPDCRPEYIAAFQRMADLATRAGVEGHGTRIAAPLLNLSKSAIIRRGLGLGVDFAQTLSCYDPQGTVPGAPRPCAECDACRLRAAAFAELGLTDPALSAHR